MTNEQTILELERAALDRWGKGDPDGFLELSAEDVTYFDPFIKQRVNDKASLKALYDSFRGQVKIESSEIIDPKVQVFGDVAVLTFRFRSGGSEGAMLWNTTEVYRQIEGQWKIVHTHWALPK